MGDAEVPSWLKSLPLAPEYRPSETEFADPIAFISKIEEAAAKFGICKVVPPITKPSRKFVFHNLNRSLSKSPDLGPAVDGGNPRHTPEGAVFTTRHQELGSRRTRMQAIHKQVWQSGELYTLEQFEAKARAFARAHLGGPKCMNPLFVEDMFWKAVEEKPLCIEYANDVPGSGFGVPKEPFLFKPRRRWRRRFNRGCGNMVEELCGNIPSGKSECLGPGNEWEGSAGWKLSNSPWNLQVIARSPGSLTRFMPDEVPGVTSPMVYIGMLFSWFAWHVEDHELHSLNFLHTGASKTWYAVPGSYASKFEEVVRMQGYGGLVDRLAAFTLLGEKTTLISPDVIVQSGIPCCRLVQHPGEFVVTFPRAYHVGFSHGFNCGEAANFATQKWLKVAKEAAVRRAAMNYLPMLSHQQLLYMLTMSFISRVPRAFLPGVRSSRLRDRKKEERETLVKKAFLDDLKDEHHLIHRLFGKDEAFYGVLWHPDLLPSPSNDSQKFPSSPCCEGSVSECRNEMALCDVKTNVSPEPKKDGYLEKDMADGQDANTSDIPAGSISSSESQKYGDAVNILDSERIQSSYVDEGDLPCGLDVDSGSLACVACGILGYPFMSIVQPSDKASKLLYAEREVTDEKVGNLKQTKTSLPFFLVGMTKESANSEDSAVFDSLPPTNINNSGHDNIMAIIKPDVYQVEPADKHDPERNNTKVDLNESDLSDKLRKDNHSMNTGVIHTVGDGSESPSNNSVECCHETGAETIDLENRWNTSTKFVRPRIFCLQHALEICELLQSKGGAHVLVICHSDYLKIKAHAMSVAEDIDTRLDFEDVPLKDASQADLDLIYMSIDDEEHEEDGEDWTAEMGLNLRYCVKLRKQCSSNQEQLTLGLDGIFSKKNPPIISGLKWHCRKSRTQQRMITPAHSRSQSTVNMHKGKPAMRRSFSDPCARTQIEIDKTCNNEMQHKRRRGRPRKNPSADLLSRTGASAPDNKTSILVPCSSECLTRAFEVPVDGLSTLADLPFTSALAPEDVQRHEECMIIDREEAKPACVIDDSAMTEDTTSCSIPDVENYTSQLQINSRMVENGLDVISNPTASTQDLQRNKDCSSECGSENCAVGNFVDSECQPSIVSQTVTCLDRRQGSGHKTQTEGKVIMSDGSLELHDVLTTEETKVVFSSSVLNDQPMNYETIVNGSEVQQEMMNSTVCNSLVECFFTKPEMGTNANTDMRVGDVDSTDLTSSIRISNAKISEIPQIPNTAQEENSKRDTFDLFKSVKEDGVRNTVQLKLYERRRKKRQAEADQIKCDSNPILRKKRKRKGDQMLSVQLSCDGFVRSPCEGLRSRGGQAIFEKALSSKFKKTSQVKRHWSEHDGLVGQKSIDESSGPYQCNLQGCHMSFQTGGELSLHKRNRCTYEGCGKRFSSHKYAARHQCVHADERPLKCPWKGCNVTFKWDWARTEHVRVHTGERPYKCEVPGCGLAFRFISEFSRHRRKTGHPSGNFVASSTNM